MNNLGSVLHKPWRASSMHTAKINGIWAEDGSGYEITAPPQLIKHIIEMQNLMSNQYKEIQDREDEIIRMQLELAKVKSHVGWVDFSGVSK